MKAALLLPAALLASALALSAASESFHQSYPLTPGGTVNLENVNGNVEIVGWDKQEVCIDAEKTAPSDEKLKAIQIKVKATAEKISVETEFEKKLFNWSNRGGVNYRIQVPIGSHLGDVGTVNGTIKLSGVSGKVHLETVNGRIEASSLQNDAHLEVVNGSVHASFTSLPAKAEVHIESVNGSCEIVLPADTNAKLSAETVNGSAHCELPLTDSSSKRNHLKGTLGNGDASIKIESVNGSVSVRKL